MAGAWIKCPKCGGDVYVPTACGICAVCSLMVYANGETSPAPWATHYNGPCDMVIGPCCCGAWHDEQSQIDRSRETARRLAAPAQAQAGEGKA